MSNKEVPSLEEINIESFIFNSNEIKGNDSSIQERDKLKYSNNQNEIDLLSSNNSENNESILELTKNNENIELNEKYKRKYSIYKNI